MKLEQSETSKFSTIPVSPIMSLFCWVRVSFMATTSIQLVANGQPKTNAMPWPILKSSSPSMLAIHWWFYNEHCSNKQSRSALIKTKRSMSKHLHQDCDSSLNSATLLTFLLARLSLAKETSDVQMQFFSWWKSDLLPSKYSQIWSSVHAVNIWNT